MKTKTHAKFLCDEDFPRTIGKFLKERGISVIDLPKHMRGRSLPDIQVLRYAVKQQKILLTKDRDFLHNEQFTELIQRSMGIVHFVNPPPSQTIREQMVAQFFKVFSEAKIAGRVLRITATTHHYVVPIRNKNT